jgi:DNA-binding CsgD family transcriptional regulator
MVFDKAYLPIVESIYDAAVDPTRWATALEKLSAPTDGKGFIVIHDPQMAAGSCPIFANWEASAIDSYNKYYASRNAWLARVATRPVGKAEPSEFFLGRSDLLKTEWYNDFLRPNRLQSGTGVTVLRDGGRFVSAGVLIPRCTDAEHAAHVALLQRVTPHLERALKVNRQLSGADFRWRTAEECLDRLKIGVVVAGQSGKVLFANAEAKRILSQNDGLCLDREGRLLAGAHQDNEWLRRTLHSIVTGGDLRGESGVLSVRRRSGRRPYGLLAAPLRPPDQLFGAEGRMAILFISDISSRQPSAGRLAETFGLTPAEGRLLHVLLQGHGLSEAAALLGISANTAKTQLQSLFGKTDCSRQADLVKIAMSHPAWLAA